MENSQKLNIGHKINPDMLDDLASRFIINVPVEERCNLIRICFQIELAHWFYLDFFCTENTNFTPCGLKQFATHLFNHIPFLRKNLQYIDQTLEAWKQYKLSVPTYGAILLSENLKNVLLVQSYWAKSSWGFPKGKINENEEPVHCAVREVFEETGYDIKNLISSYEYIESNINDQYTRLYIVRDIPMDTVFLPRTRNEIKCCEWFNIDFLPSNKNDTISKTNLQMNANSFFMIIPFVKRLKKWVNDKRVNNFIQQHANYKQNPLLTNNKINSINSYIQQQNDEKQLNIKRQRHRSTGDLENFTNSNNNTMSPLVPIKSSILTIHSNTTGKNVQQNIKQQQQQQQQQLTNKQKTKANYKRKLFKMSSPSTILYEKNITSTTTVVPPPTTTAAVSSGIIINNADKINNIAKAAKQNKQKNNHKSINPIQNQNQNQNNENMLMKKMGNIVDFSGLDKWKNFKFDRYPIIDVFC